MFWIKHNIASDYFKKQLEDKIKGIQDHQVEVGFFEDAKYDDGTPVAQVAKDHNLGTSEVPPRPFFKIAADKHKKKWVRTFKKALRHNRGVLAWDDVGEMMRNDIVKTITKIKKPPNSKKTIKLKGSSNPLVDTSFMRDSVSYLVVKTKGNE